jgi:hypothetical protein
MKSCLRKEENTLHYDVCAVREKENSSSLLLLFGLMLMKKQFTF